MKLKYFSSGSLLLALALIIAFFSLSYASAEQRTFSEDENRMLQALPSFSLKRLADGTLSARLHDWFSDRIALRSQLVELKALTELALGKRENNGVLLASNGYLIETHRYTESNYSHIKSNLAKLELLREGLKERGVSVTSAIVPRKLDVLKDELPELYPSEQSERAWELVDGSNIDLRDALNGENVFYKTDHHLTCDGIYSVYCALGESIGYIPFSREHFETETLTESFFGTSYSRSGFFFAEPDEIVCPTIPRGKYSTETVDTQDLFDGLYDLSYLEKKDKYSVFLGGNHAHVKISKNNSESEAERPALLIVKDSFSHALAPYLAEHFELELIDPRYFHGSIEKHVNENGIENVLFLFGLDTLATAELGIR